MRGGFIKEATQLGKDSRESKKLDNESAKAALESTAKRWDLIGQVSGAARDQASWDRGLAMLKQAGVDTSNLPPQFDPAVAQQGVQAAMTGIQQAQAKHQELTLAETGRHNRAGEGNQAATLAEMQRAHRTNEGIAGGHLAVAQQGNVLKEQEIAMGGKPPPGYTWEGPNKLAAIPGGPGSKPTDAQASAANYAGRMVQADKLLQPIESKINNMGLKAKQKVEGMAVVGDLANAALSPDQQSVDQAQRDFLNAVLRRESGAVISDQEFANARKQYFVQPGDSKTVIDQKRANRAMSIKGISGAAGPVAPQAATGGFRILGVE
jgi:hypothetical protein